MTLTDGPDGTDLSPDDAELSTISNLSAGVPGTVPENRSPAEQGDAPEGVGSREAPPVPTPSRNGLSADEVARLTGTHESSTDESSTDESSTDASNALNRAEGITPDDED